MELFVHRWGAGPEVVLLHGAGHGSREAWVGQRPLTERWTLLAVDRVGHGRSPDGRQDAEVDGALVAAQLLGEPRHLAGFSYGALAAMFAAAARPAGVRSLLLVEPPALSVAPEHPMVQRVGARLDALLADPPASMRELGETFLRMVGVPDGLPDDVPPTMERAVEALRGMRSPAELELPLDALREAPFDVLVVTGGHSAFYDVVADAIASATGGRRVVVPGARHLVAMTGEPFNAVAEAFWREADQPRAGAGSTAAPRM